MDLKNFTGLKTLWEYRVVTPRPDCSKPGNDNLRLVSAKVEFRYESFFIKTDSAQYAEILLQLF